MDRFLVMDPEPVSTGGGFRFFWFPSYCRFATPLGLKGKTVG